MREAQQFSGMKKKFQNCQESLKSPLIPRSCEKIQGTGNGKRSHVQGTGKICLPKEALISSLSAGYELMPGGKWKAYFIYAG